MAMQIEIKEQEPVSRALERIEIQNKLATEKLDAQIRSVRLGVRNFSEATVSNEGALSELAEIISEQNEAIADLAELISHIINE